MVKTPIFFIVNTFLCVVFLLVAVGQALYPNAITDKMFEISYTSLIALIAVFSLIGAYFIPHWHKMLKIPATLLSIALVCSAVGDLFWFYIVNFLHIEIPYPSVADVWYVLFYPITYLALLVLLVYLANKDTKFSWFINGSLIITTLLIFCGAFLTKFLHSGAYTPEKYENLVVVFDNLYLIGDGLLLAHLIVVAFFAFIVPKTEQKLLAALVAVGIGTVCTLIADTVFSYLAEVQAYEPGSFVDVLFFLGTYCISFGVAKLVSMAKDSNIASAKLLGMR